MYREFIRSFWAFCWDHATCTGNLLGVFGCILLGSCYMYREFIGVFGCVLLGSCYMYRKFIRSFWVHSVGIMLHVQGIY